MDSLIVMRRSIKSKGEAKLIKSAKAKCMSPTETGTGAPETSTGALETSTGAQENSTGAPGAVGELPLRPVCFVQLYRAACAYNRGWRPRSAGARERAAPAPAPSLSSESSDSVLRSYLAGARDSRDTNLPEYYRRRPAARLVLELPYGERFQASYDS